MAIIQRLTVKNKIVSSHHPITNYQFSIPKDPRPRTIRPIEICQLSTINYQLLTINYQLSNELPTSIWYATKNQSQRPRKSQPAGRAHRL
ncbi:MAG: hypothetical protein ACRC62_11725 [Microcoleus sp.]